MALLEVIKQKICKHKVLCDWLPYLVVVLFVVGPWFVQPGYTFFPDFSWGRYIPLDWTDSWFYIYLLARLFSFVLPISLVQKIIVDMALLVIILGGKKISEQFLTNKALIFVASLFTLFNPFVYDRLLYGQIGIIMAYGLLTYAVGFAIEYIRERRFKQVIWMAIMLGIGIQFSPHIIFFIFGFGLIFIPLLFKKESLSDFIKPIAIMFGIIAILNMHWLFGLFSQSSIISSAVSGGIGHSDLTAFQVQGDSALDVVGNILLTSGFWAIGDGRYQALADVEKWGRSFWFTIPVIIFGLILGFRSRQDRRLSVGLLILLIVSVVLAAGIRLPVAREATYWLFDNFSPYRGLRETHKWVQVLPIIYTVFLSIGLRGLWEYKLIENHQKVIQFFLIVVIVMQAPFLLFGLRGQVSAVEYPSDWYEIDNFIINDSGCGNKIIFLPWHLYMSFDFIGRVVANPAESFFTCSVVKSRDPEIEGVYNDKGEEQNLTSRWIEREMTLQNMEEQGLDIGYILLAKEIDWQDYFWLDESGEVERIKETENFILYKKQ